MMDSDEDAAGIIKGGTVSRAEDTGPENSILFRQHLVFFRIRIIINGQ